MPESTIDLPHDLRAKAEAGAKLAGLSVEEYLWALIHRDREAGSGVDAAAHHAAMRTLVEQGEGNHSAN